MVGFVFTCCGVCGFRLICLFVLLVVCLFVFDVGVDFGGLLLALFAIYVWLVVMMGLFAFNSVDYFVIMLLKCCLGGYVAYDCLLFCWLT